MKMFDTHCHLDFNAFENDRDQVLLSCKKSCVNKIIVPGVSSNNWDDVLKLCADHTMLYPALGLHPCFTDQHQNSDIDRLEQLLSSQSTIIAIGEAGLDYYDKNADRQQQINILKPQLELAQQLNKPVLLHVRKAHTDMLAILKDYELPGGIIHAFNGSLEQAQEYIKSGFKFGFGGTMTNPNAKRIHYLAHELKLEDIVLETDSPDMVGILHHGERNSPEFLPEYLQALATIRKQPVSEVAEQVYQNSLEVFSLVDSFS